MARQAAAIDDLSGGRLHLGLGAGWQEQEHHSFGYDLLDRKPRFARYREGVEVVTRLLRNDEPVTFEGSYYQLRDAILLPRPQRPGGPRIVIGGNGPQLTLPLAAQYADEWNCVYLTPENFATLNTRLDRLAAQHGRPDCHPPHDDDRRLPDPRPG
jgi:alkanesulfonate monooxygenase SsuD/methylene tetrahydromethanopterin reductase-like flavin-dependent oxidoreductase (luciferase family)